LFNGKCAIDEGSDVTCIAEGISYTDHIEMVWHARSITGSDGTVAEEGNFTVVNQPGPLSSIIYRSTSKFPANDTGFAVFAGIVDGSRSTGTFAGAEGVVACARQYARTGTSMTLTDVVSMSVNVEA